MRNTLLSGVVVLVAGPVLAEERVACFCLLNPATQMVERWGCEAREIESRGIERVRCQKTNFDGRETMKDLDHFKRVPDGEGQCEPCYQSLRGRMGDDVREGPSARAYNPEAEPANE